MAFEAIKQGTAKNKQVDKQQVDTEKINLSVEEELNESELVGSTDLTVAENLQIKTASLALTHRIEFERILTSPVRNRMKPRKELNTQEWKRIIDKLHAEGVERVVIMGGEPTIREDFHTLLQYCINMFEKVTVQTNGTTNRNLSNYDCAVSLPIDFWNPIDNNEIRRLTDPQKYVYHRNKQALIERQPLNCTFCGKKLESTKGAFKHIKGKHEDEALNMYQQKVNPEAEDLKQAMNANKNVDYTIFLERSDAIPIMENEKARTLAQQKLESLAESDNDTIIRTQIMNNNNIFHIIAYAQKIGADVVFKPLYPNGHDRLEEQIPSPKRFLETMEKVWQLNGEIRENLVIDNPHYKAWSFQLDVQNGIKPDYSNEEYVQWLKRGRVSEVGVSKLHIQPNGIALPSRYLRKDRYELGSVLDKDFEYLYDELAHFNREIMKKDLDHRKMKDKYPDIRRRSIAQDLNVSLTKPYTKQEEVKN